MSRATKRNGSTLRRKPGKRWRVLAHENGAPVELRNQGTFDELVVDNWLHLEQMSENDWWMRLGPLYIWVHLEKDGTTKVGVHVDYPSKSVVEVTGDVTGTRDGPPWWVEDKEPKDG